MCSPWPVVKSRKSHLAPGLGFEELRKFFETLDHNHKGCEKPEGQTFTSIGEFQATCFSELNFRVQGFGLREELMELGLGICSALKGIGFRIWSLDWSR